MLPFPKRKSSHPDDLSIDVEISEPGIELSDADLLAVGATPLPSSAKAAPSKPPSRPAAKPAVTEDSTTACLSSLAETLSKAIPPSPAEPFPPLPPPSGLDVLETTEFARPAIPGVPALPAKLPAVSPPPFVRTSLQPWPRPAHAEDRAPSSGSMTATSSKSGSIFVRDASSIGPAATGSSVAPVAMPSRHEPTVVLVRERPKAPWIVGSAVVGAIVAVLTMRFAGPAAPEPAPAAAAAPAFVETLEAKVPVKQAMPVATITRPAAPTVVEFKDDDAVSITTSMPLTYVPAASAAPVAKDAPAPAKEAPAKEAPAKEAPTKEAVAPRPHAPAAPKAPKAKAAPAAASPPPMMPDGSLGLSSHDAPSSGPSNPRSLAKTPEQELAEQQLLQGLK